MSYKKLEVWQLARELSIEIHEMTHQKATLLGKKLNNFLRAIQDQHNKPQEPGVFHEPEVDYSQPESSIQYPESD
jgi:hypothetical protein